MHEWHRENYLINDDGAQLDLTAIHDFLSRAYWCEGIPMATVERAIKHSLCFGVYENQQQIGFARVVTDRATFGYLCDVYILEDYRGKGLAKWLMQCVMAHPDLQGLRRFMLGTRNAHELYAPLGFALPKFPDRLMEILLPDCYKKTE
jgi:GNAT superfamily N-acetyltransferase